MTAEKNVKLIRRGKKGEDEFITRRLFGQSRLQARQSFIPTFDSLPYNKLPSVPGDYNTGRTTIPKLTHPTKGMWAYPAGSRPPACYDLVNAFFMPDGSPYDDTALPLNKKTFEMFNKQCYQWFLQGKLAGMAVYEPPNYQDVAKILASNPELAIEMVKIPSSSRPVLKRKRVKAFGLSTSRFEPNPDPDSKGAWYKSEPVDPEQIVIPIPKGKDPDVVSLSTQQDVR